MILSYSDFFLRKVNTFFNQGFQLNETVFKNFEGSIQVVGIGHINTSFLDDFQRIVWASRLKVSLLQYREQFFQPSSLLPQIL